jgi:hypothetical protein
LVYQPGVVVISPTDPQVTIPEIQMQNIAIPMKKKEIGTKIILKVSATKSEAASRTPIAMLRDLKEHATQQ